MKLRWLLVFALAVLTGGQASAQVSAYVDFSASKLTGLGTNGSEATNVLYGPTIGLTAHVAGLKRLQFAADLRAGFYGSGQKLDEIALGPKASLGVRKFTVYTEFLVGFGRYNDGLGHSASASTDAQIELNSGIDRRVTKRFDWRVFEYGYEQYYGLGGNYNPKTFSTGLVFHLGV
jgi:hypothetical protein